LQGQDIVQAAEGGLFDTFSVCEAPRSTLQGGIQGCQSVDCYELFVQGVCRFVVAAGPIFFLHDGIEIPCYQQLFFVGPSISD
jgi:hypothetical protein